MSKKNLLNEHTIRRFGGLAGIQPATTSNFLAEVEVGEDELADALAAGAEAMADTLGLDVAVEVEAGEGEELDDLEDDFGELEGEEDAVEDEIDGLEDEEDAIHDEEEGIDDLEDEEETLDELIGRILQEDDEEELDEGLEEGEGSKWEKGEHEYKRRGKSAKHPVGHRAGETKGTDGKMHYKTGEEEDLAEEEGSKWKKGEHEYKRRDKKGKVGKRAGVVDGHYKTGETTSESHIRVVDDEYIMQEVSRRVKHRLANLVKESRRRKRLTKRRK